MIFPKVYYHRKLEDVKLHILYPFLLEWWREFCQPLLSHDHHGHRDGGVTVPEIDDLSNTTGLSQLTSLKLGTPGLTVILTLQKTVTTCRTRQVITTGLSEIRVFLMEASRSYK